MAISILLADDHPLIADGIKITFQNTAEFEVKCVVTNGQEVLDFLENNWVDIVLLDIDMPIMDGITCATKIIEKYPKVKIAMLSMHQEKSIIKKLIAMGVKAYLLKTIPSNELLQAIKSVYEGKEFFSADLTKALLADNFTNIPQQQIKKSPLVDLLTAREKEIIKYLSQGLTNTQIGKKLFISPRTVDTHRTNIMKKLDLHNVASLVRFAFQNQLIS